MDNIADKTLNTILLLIDKDVEIIKQNISDVHMQLDDKTAQTLCRYATSLSGIKDNKKKELESEKKLLNSKSTDELIQEYIKSKQETKELE